MLVYLGGPIDLVSESERHDWRRFFKGALTDLGISSFDPAAAFSYNPTEKSDAEKLIEINKDALFTCDFAVFVMSRATPSIGTPIELYLAKMCKVPHVVIWDPALALNDKKRKKLRREDLPAYVLGVADKVVGSFGEAIDKIESFRFSSSSGSLKPRSASPSMPTHNPSMPTQMGFGACMDVCEPPQEPVAEIIPNYPTTPMCNDSDH